ncbi:O-methyltransferase [Paecilomyces variotii No. 5]|uniref:O-methyltransferase n=1 Tax=Byssochlamys spectabilis (strain No. 5 / NBRC 109023) TaxID=1356009 RepID=V5I0Y0_BYSSN|nr:O-methyltransferase [Paecilomyces variotii No. 5]
MSSLDNGQTNAIRILALAETLAKISKDYVSSRHTPEEHLQLLSAIREIQLLVETPTETVLRLIYQPPQNAALRTAVELGVFSILSARSQGKSMVTATEISSETGADRALIVRLMRVMSALGLCSNPKPEVWSANEKTAVMVQPTGKDGVSCLYDLSVPTLAKLPEYLHLHGYKNPKDYSRSPMQWAVGESQFEWLARDQKKQALFDSYMSSRRQGKPSWFETYPVQDLLDGAIQREDAVFIVDVGGNHGHDLQKFNEMFPTVPGRLVLQDLPTVIKSAPRLEGLETMAYSFYDPQPIKGEPSWNPQNKMLHGKQLIPKSIGARAYTFRAIFHDWPDHICRKILTNTSSAMEPTYSKLIIIDFVLPDTDVPLFQASLDIQMMSIGAGVERSETQWRELLHSAGFEIVRICRKNPGMEAVIEAVPMSV